MTVTLGAPKLPLVLPPAETHAGDIVIADIGIPDRRVRRARGPLLELLTRERDARARRRPRPPSHTRATTAACWSSPARVGKTGAAHLAASARCGRAPGW